MGLFKKTKKPEPVEKYVAPEAVEPQVPAPPAPMVEEWKQHHLQMLQNQAIIAGNQQSIIEAIAALGQRIEQLAEGEDLPVVTEEAPPEEEFTDEELEQALRIARERQAAAVVKKKGR